MGTAAWIDKVHFRMNAASEGAAVAALKSAFPDEATFLARGIHQKPAAFRHLAEARTFADALRALSGLDEHAIVQEVPGGGVTGLGREGMMDELPIRAMARFFAPIAPFVEPGSFIELETDHGSCWTRLEFQGGRLRVVERELGADDLGDWDMIEHDRTEALLDPDY